MKPFFLLGRLLLILLAFEFGWECLHRSFLHPPGGNGWEKNHVDEGGDLGLVLAGKWLGYLAQEVEREADKKTEKWKSKSGQRYKRSRGHDGHVKCGAAAKRRRDARKFRPCLLTVKKRQLGGQENVGNPGHLNCLLQTQLCVPTDSGAVP